MNTISCHHAKHLFHTLNEIRLHNEICSKNERFKFYTNYILLFAVTHGCIDWFKNEITSCLWEEGITTKVNSQIQRAFSPIGSCGGDNFYQPKDDETKSNLDDDFLDPASNQQLPSKASPSFSPNALTLFLEKIAIPRHSHCAPPINHRPLDIKRIWRGDAIAAGEDHGIVATLLGLSTNMRLDPTLTALDYAIFPYTIIAPKTALATETVAAAGGTPQFSASKYILKHEYDCICNHMSSHVSPDDIKRLLQLLTEVCLCMHTHSIH